MASSDGNRYDSSIVPQIQDTFRGECYYNPAGWQFKIVSPSNINGNVTAMLNAFLYKGQSSDDTVMTVESGLPRDKSMEMQPPSDNGNPEAGEPAVTPSCPKRKVVEDLNDNQISQLKNPPGDKVQVLWIGHASLLIQMEGKNILTDPVFSDTVGMTNVLGYHRYRKPALYAEDLHGPDLKIDIVLISHNHYDHLDKASVKKLAALNSAIQWFVPMGLKKKFKEWGCKTVKECTWWEQSPACGMMLYFTPAKHWSARGPHDWYTSLWGSWIVKSERFTVFFAGDTGYQEEIFTDISERFGRVDVALLPIGAYEPRQMMKCQHINPEEAVKIHKHLGARKSIGIHWRTFKLSTEGVDQPITDLKRAMDENGLGKNDFVTLEEDLMTTIDYAKKEEKDSKEKARKCVCGNANRYKRYVNHGELLGVLCEKCGKEWLHERYFEKSSKVDGNGLLYEENMFYFHNAHSPTERNTKQFTLKSLKEGDHLILNDCEETRSGRHEAIVETINSETTLSVILFRRSSPSEVTISRAKLDASELKNAKVVPYDKCDSTEVVKARALAWCDGCPQVANLFEFQCLARYCKCGSDESFQTWWLVGVPFTNTLSRLVDYESWTVCEGPNSESSVSELREVKAVGALIEINGTSIILDLSNGRNGFDLSKNRVDDDFCEKLLVGLRENGELDVLKTENNSLREYVIKIFKDSEVQVTFSVQCIKDGNKFHVAKGTFNNTSAGSSFGNLIQKYVKREDKTVKLKELQSGDHVVLTGSFLHPRCHAIVISVDSDANQLRLIRSTYEKGVVEEWIKAPPQVLRVGGDKSIGPDFLIQTARSKIGGQNDYNIVTNNCKHFVQWCKEQKPMK